MFKLFQLLCTPAEVHMLEFCLHQERFISCNLSVRLACRLSGMPDHVYRGNEIMLKGLLTMQEADYMDLEQSEVYHALRRITSPQMRADGMDAVHYVLDWFDNKERMHYQILACKHIMHVGLRFREIQLPAPLHKYMLTFRANRRARACMRLFDVFDLDCAEPLLVLIFHSCLHPYAAYFAHLSFLVTREGKFPANYEDRNQYYYRMRRFRAWCLNNLSQDHRKNLATRYTWPSCIQLWKEYLESIPMDDIGPKNERGKKIHERFIRDILLSTIRIENCWEPVLILKK